MVQVSKLKLSVKGLSRILVRRCDLSHSKSERMNMLVSRGTSGARDSQRDRDGGAEDSVSQQDRGGGRLSALMQLGRVPTLKWLA